MTSQCRLHYCNGLFYRTAGNSFVSERECFVIHFGSAAFICLVFKFPFALFAFLAWNCNLAVALRFNNAATDWKACSLGNLLKRSMRILMRGRVRAHLWALTTLFTLPLFLNLYSASVVIWALRFTQQYNS